MRQYAKQAKKQRLSGDHHNNGDITGFCLDNAYVLYNILSSNGYDPQIVCGVSENYASTIISEKGLDNIEYVEDLEGQVHYWVECNNKIIDIASDIKESYGHIIISNGLPDEYHKLDDSVKYANEIISSMPPRCTYCGGRLNHCGCAYENK